MKREKYISSGGLAYAEDRDMKKLQKYSLKGWHVKAFKFMGYKLEKGECADYIYCIDYRTLEDGEAEEYFEVLSWSGWSHVASEGNIHLFKAQPGTKPIYTDDETMAEKYSSSSKYVAKFAFPAAALTLLAWIGTLMSSGILHTFLFILAVVLTGIAVAFGMTSLTALSNKWRTEGKRKTAGFGKVSPFIIILIGIIILLITGESDNSARILASAAVGGIGLPIIIWAMMSLFIKWRSKSHE